MTTPSMMSVFISLTSARFTLTTSESKKETLLNGESAYIRYRFLLAQIGVTSKFCLMDHINIRATCSNVVEQMDRFVLIHRILSIHTFDEHINGLSSAGRSFFAPFDYRISVTSVVAFRYHLLSHVSQFLLASVVFDILFYEGFEGENSLDFRAILRLASNRLAFDIQKETKRSRETKVTFLKRVHVLSSVEDVIVIIATIFGDIISSRRVSKAD